MNINPPAAEPQPPASPRRGAPTIIRQGKDGAPAPLTSRAYLATEWCAAILATGLSAASELVSLKGSPAAGAVGVLARWRPCPAPAAADCRQCGPAVPMPGAGEHSRWIDLDGPVHYLDFGGPADGPTVVCVHGLAGSADNWSAIAPSLTDR